MPIGGVLYTPPQLQPVLWVTEVRYFGFLFQKNRNLNDYETDSCIKTTAQPKKLRV